MRDLHNNVHAANAIAPTTVTTAGGAIASGNLDLAGFLSAEFIASFGASGDTLSATDNLTVKVEHADDANGVPGAYAAVVAQDVLGAVPDADGVVVTVDDPAEDGAAYRFGYVGCRRFLRVTVTPAGTHTNGTPVAVALVKGHPLSCPVV